MFKLNFDTSNAVFDDDTAREVARILRKLADELDAIANLQEGRNVGGTIADVNGNRIGTWALMIY